MSKKNKKKKTKVKMALIERPRMKIVFTPPTPPTEGDYLRGMMDTGEAVDEPTFYTFTGVVSEIKEQK